MTALEFAKTNGYTGVKYLHLWNGYKVYKPEIKGQDGKTGLPLVILELNDEYHISTPEEALNHFDDMGWNE